MQRTWTIIAVADVSASFKWYQTLFGQPETLPAHLLFFRLDDFDLTLQRGRALVERLEEEPPGSAIGL